MIGTGYVSLFAGYAWAPRESGRDLAADRLDRGALEESARAAQLGRLAALETLEHQPLEPGVDEERRRPRVARGAETGRPRAACP